MKHRRPSQRGATPTRNGKRYRASLTTAPGVTVYLGTFDVERRACLAYRLFRLWVARGHSWESIPRVPLNYLARGE